MSSAYPWYLAHFVGIGVPPRHKNSYSSVTTTRAHGGDSFGEERNVSVDAA
jgi:hypothetical protein